jgi:hypothetical protein
MPAPDYQTLMGYADNVNAAAVDAFRDDNLPAFGHRDINELPKERLDLITSGFAKASEQMVQDAGGTWHDSHFAGQTVVTIITQRGNPEAAARHRTHVGRATYLMSREAQSFNATRLPYYEMLSSELTASSSYEHPESDTDRTELTFSQQIGLKPSAFPV